MCVCVCVCVCQSGHANTVSNEDGYSILSDQDDGHANLWT